ncbi:MAG TPA: SDR family NAD(P)-dependent oxidoreductase [Candidatus Sulfotelmatobacter sp.]|nr:SDR family NAD(P)-dependent oxidoreductase [Candidatus Sulfotelmatobacter sp.]
MAASMLLRQRRSIALRGKTVFVTGGSRGLGLLLAQEFARRGAKVAISARDRSELERAETHLRTITDEVLTLEVDMTMREEVELAIQKIEQNFGAPDILVNNAGTITVGPVETMTIDDYRDSINTHFWGPYFASMAVLPSFQRRREGRIVNISSIGGKISVPHLLPYSVGKFALTGFSEGLRSELLKDNIYVTTVCPGLMRTGSPRNASFKGNNEAEYAWFSISDALPLISTSAKRAARRIVNACVCGEAEVVLSLPGAVATKLHSLFPGMTTDVLGLINVLLPPPGGIGHDVRTGKQSSSRVSPSWITTLNEQAAQENNQVP